MLTTGVRFYYVLSRKKKTKLLADIPNRGSRIRIAVDDDLHDTGDPTHTAIQKLWEEETLHVTVRGARSGEMPDHGGV